MEKITPQLEDHEMRALGFTDRVSGVWYFCAPVGPAETLNVSIIKKTGVWTEDVLDEYFGQPAYYGVMREPYRTEVRNKIDQRVRKLQEAGLNVSVDHREYGISPID